MLRRALIVGVLGGLCGLAFYRVQERVVPNFDDTGRALPRGAFHVHSEASHDCDTTLEEIAAAAKSLGMSFVVVTDHDVQLADSITIDGVTILSSAELRTPFGHVIQLGASDILPHAQRGEMTIHQSIAALGGIPIIAHPSDPKRPWVGPIVGAGGLEIANLAASARRRGGVTFLGLLPAFTIWRIRPDLAMAQVYDRDDAALRRWDGETDPRFVGLCGTDAHGRISLRRNLPAWQVVLEEDLPEAPEDRGAAIIDIISRGRFHCSAGIVGKEPRLEFFARLTGGGVAPVGETVSLSDVEELVIEGPTAAPEEPLVLLMRNGEEVVRTRGEELVYTHPGPGTYRVEIRARLPNVLFGERVVPVLYSNRIRVRSADRWPMPPDPADSVPRLQ